MMTTFLLAGAKAAVVKVKAQKSSMQHPANSVKPRTPAQFMSPQSRFMKFLRVLEREKEETRTSFPRRCCVEASLARSRGEAQSSCPSWGKNPRIWGWIRYLYTPAQLRPSR